MFLNIFGPKVPLKQRLLARQKGEVEMQSRLKELSDKTGVEVSILSNSKRTLKLLQLIADDGGILLRIADLRASGFRVSVMSRGANFGGGFVSDDGKTAYLLEGSSRRALRRFLE